MEQMLCDRCKVVMDKKAQIERVSLKLTYHRNAIHKLGLDLDLCPDCSTKFVMFMNQDPFEKMVLDVKNRTISIEPVGEGGVATGV